MNNDLTDCIKKFLGRDEYNTPTNICRNDYWYLDSLYERFDEYEVKKELKRQQCLL